MKPLAAVTGASAGLGAEFSRQLALRGYDLLLIARRAERLERLASDLQARHGTQSEILTADLTDDLQRGRVEERLAETNLDLLVNNAGFGSLGTFMKVPLDGQDAMHRLHVLATMRLCRAALTGMIERDRGGIINVSSVAAFAAAAGSVSYCATKAWMNFFTEGLFLELRLRSSHVRVQALCPGYTRTEFHQTLNMDTSRIPGFLWLSAPRVVAESLAGFDRGKLFVIPGLRYRVLIGIYGLIPRSLRHAIALQNVKFRKPK